MKRRSKSEGIKWISLVGDFKSLPDGLVFRGGEVEVAQRGTGAKVGNFVCDRLFGAGHIQATIRFVDLTERAACALILYHHPPTGGFVTAQLGGLELCSVRSWGGNEWTVFAAQGPADQLLPGKDYEFAAEVVGSRVTVSLDGIRTLSTNLPFLLPRGHVGIWALGYHDIEVRGFVVKPSTPKLFVVMQYTPPYNELHSDVIVPMAHELGFQVVRADDSYGPGIVIADIERQIIEARVVIAEITPANPNVFWEVGYAHALKKPTILIAERDTRLPFDVSPFRVLFYENSIAGKKKVEDGLRKHLAAIDVDWSAS